MFCEDHPNCEGASGTFDHPYYNELCHERMSLEFRNEDVPCEGRCAGCLCYDSVVDIGNDCKCPLLHFGSSKIAEREG